MNMLKLDYLFLLHPACSIFQLCGFTYRFAICMHDICFAKANGNKHTSDIVKIIKLSRDEKNCKCCVMTYKMCLHAIHSYIKKFSSVKLFLFLSSIF
jgi:hypothetical protein